MRDSHLRSIAACEKVRPVAAEVMLQSSLRFAPAKVNVEKRPDGSIVLRSLRSSAPMRRCVTEMAGALVRPPAGEDFPCRALGDGWRRIGYRESYGAVRRIGSAPQPRAEPERPVAILSDNSTITPCWRSAPCMSACRWRRSPRRTL